MVLLHYICCLLGDFVVTLSSRELIPGLLKVYLPSVLILGFNLSTAHTSLKSQTCW
jgi:hypothetical protein